MKILSHFVDRRIQAVNVLVEVSMQDYLQIADSILNENEFQRKKVINSQISALLREDIIVGCSVPPLVLAVHQDLVPDEFNYEQFSEENLSIIQAAFREKKLLILDGKQRTHVFLRLDNELRDNPKKEEINQAKNQSDIARFYGNTIRLEVYIGINKLNILYRMLTLNSGQTSMSTRHLMEMLYLDYLDVEFDQIKLIPDKANQPVAKNQNEFIFKDVLDGFTSYLDKDENTLERSEILDNIKSAKNIKKEDGDKLLFETFVKTFKLFVDKTLELSGGYELSDEDLKTPEYLVKAQPFGRTAIEIFKRSQTISGFGAAIAELRDTREDFSLDTVAAQIPHIAFQEENYTTTALLINKHFDTIRDKSKKIGNDQRFYFKTLFRYLFDPEWSYSLRLDKAIEQAYKKTREEKSYLRDINE